MSVFGEAINAIKEAPKLADDVKRIGEILKEVSRELREHDHRITRIEAKWETAVELSGARGGSRRSLEDKSWGVLPLRARRAPPRCAPLRRTAAPDRHCALVALFGFMKLSQQRGDHGGGRLLSVSSPIRRPGSISK